jgi:hypothetical protein
MPPPPPPPPAAAAAVLRTWRVKQYHLVVCVAGNAYHPVASGLRLEGDDGQLLTHDGVDQRALA